MKLISYLLLFVTFVSVVQLERVKLYTYSPVKSYNYFPLKCHNLVFNMKCEENAHILLSNSYSYTDIPTYEIVLGSWLNTVSYLRKDQVQVAEYRGAVLDKNTFRRFWITTNDTTGTITVGTNYDTIIFNYKDPHYVTMSKFGLTASGGRTAEWDFDFDIFSCKL